MKTKKLLTVLSLFVCLLIGMAGTAFAWSSQCTNGSGEMQKGNLKIYIANCNSLDWHSYTVVGVGGLPFSISQATSQAISLTRSLTLSNALSKDSEQNVSFPPLDLSGIAFSHKTGQSASLSNSQGMGQSMEHNSANSMNFDTAFVFFVEKARFGGVSTDATMATMDYLYFNLYLGQKYGEISRLINLFLLSTSNLPSLINYNKISKVTAASRNALVVAYEKQTNKIPKTAVLQTIAVSEINGSPYPYAKAVATLKTIAVKNAAKLKAEAKAKKESEARAKTFGVVEKVILALIVLAAIGGGVWLLKKKVKITINK